MAFSFWLYCISGYYSLFPVEKYFNFGNKDKIQIKKFICLIIVNMYDSYSNSISNITKENIKNLSNCLNLTHSLPNSLFERNFEYFNNHLSKITSSETKKTVPLIEIEKLNQKIKFLFKDSKILYLENSAIDIKDEPIYQISPYIVHSNNIDYESSATSIKHAIITLINNILEKELPEVILEFNSNGLNTLATELNNDNFRSRNYCFIDDLAIEDTLKITKQYLELKEKINSIHFYNSPEIRHEVFLKIHRILFNTEVHSIEHYRLSEDQCNDYLKRYKITDSKYKIDNVVYNKRDALRVIQDTFRIENITIKFKSNISKDIGFRVKFKI